MAKRLNERALESATQVGNGRTGREICRNCGGGIVIEPPLPTAPRLPHRRVCRKCGAEYGTTRAG